MEYLAYERIRARAGSCRAGLRALLANRALAGKPEARQWRFFRDAAERLLTGDGVSEFDSLPRAQAAQLKFEIEDKLRRFYLRPGHSPEFVFALVHESDLESHGIDAAGGYPRLAGYCVLVRDLAAERVGVCAPAPEDLEAHLEKVVASCVDAEFAAYAALPEVKLDDLACWFRVSGPAYREVANILAMHSRRGWIISNPLNPSTKRILALRVKEAGPDEATVATTEYWYLRWWGTRENSYVYPYRETNRQTYILQSTAEGWRVQANLRPPPRSSAPCRWRERRQSAQLPRKEGQTT